MKYLYEGHLGGIFCSDRELTTEERFCDVCGDYDWFIGTAESFKDSWDLLKDKCDIKGSGGYDLTYVFPVLAQEFNIDFIITYADKYIEQLGFCSNTEEDILKQINNYLQTA